MTEAPRPVSILIAALGGQGGGVLTEWLVAAATHAGLPVQATSIPGVAQRTGATTYYVEIHPVRVAAGDPPPVFSLYPLPGDVDVVIASELLEAGRTVELDYVSPERTTVIASTHRLFSIGEKTVVGNGVFPEERLGAAVRAMARRAIAFDALAAARQAGSEVNAVLLGALASTAALPLGDADFEAGIREGGVAVERNLAGFRAGRDIAALDRALKPPRAAAPPWPERRAERARELGRRGAAFLHLAGRVEAEFPAALHITLGEAVARLVDYQDARWAESYLERVRAVRAADRGDGRLTERAARRLAVWLSYEDAIRVADLKTRRARFERIRREHPVPAGALFTVTDWLKPDLDELYGILPARLVRPLARWAERRWPNGRPTAGQHVRTTTLTGFLKVWLLARLRGLRPSSLRAERELALLDRWQAQVLGAAAVDEGLALEVVELAGAVRGYGDVRRRLYAAVAAALDEVVAPAVAAARAGGPTTARAVAAVRDVRVRLLADDQGLESRHSPASR